MQFSKYVVKLHEIYEDEKNITLGKKKKKKPKKKKKKIYKKKNLAMEYVQGGTLFERSWEEKGKKFFFFIFF